LNNNALLLMASMDDRLQAGRELYDQYCVVCHTETGAGLVGPNLTDAYWIHGGTPMDIHRVVTDGVTAKGMAAWGNQLGPTRVNNVVAYLLTLRGNDVPGKEAEGEFYDLAAESFEDEDGAETGEPAAEETTEAADGAES
jgi:cytochrome c oxidase cbb3-type subunit 3